MAGMMKTCRTCGETKAIAEFPVARTPAKVYVRGECRICLAARRRRYSQSNSVPIAERKKAWKAENAESHKLKRRQYYEANSEKIKAQTRQYRAERREHFSLQKAAWRAGLTTAEYLRMLAQVGDRCQICGSEESNGSNRLSIDHDHDCCPGYRSCGKCIRGVICNGCNTGLARFRDNPDTLLAAATYLLQRQDVLRPAVI
jgi:hypothetical protein